MKKSVKQAETQEVSYNHSDIRTTTVFILPALSLYPVSTDHLWITASVEGQLLHPLTLKHYPDRLPSNFDITKLNPSPLAIAHHIPSSSFDKLLVVPNPTPKYNNVSTYYDDQYLHGCTMFALCKDGLLHGRLPGSSSSWEKLRRRGTGHTFDDIVLYNGYIYAVNREGYLYLIINKPGNICIGRCVTCYGARAETRWRNRLVVEWGQIYVVVRTDIKRFHVYTSLSQGRGDLGPLERVKRYHVSKHVLFIAKDYYFFCRAGINFPGKHLKDCIVYSQDAFLRYGDRDDASRHFSQSEDNIRIVRFRDKCISRFPRINWSPPPWVFDAWSGLAAEFQSISSSKSSSQSESETDDDEALDSNGGEKKKAKVQTHVNIESDSDSQAEEDGKSRYNANNQEKEGPKIQPCVNIESDSDNQAEEFENMQCDTNSQNSQKEEDGELYYNLETVGDESLQEDKMIHSNTEDGVSLQEDVSLSLFGPESEITETLMASLSACEEEVARSLLAMKGGNDASQQVEKEMKKSEKQMEAQATMNYKQFDIRSTTIFTLPALSFYSISTDHPWITASVEGELLHPLTLKHCPYNLPANFDIPKLNPSPLAISHHIPSSSFDKLLIVPNPTPKLDNVITCYGDQFLHGCTMFALDKDGQLHWRLPGSSSSWEKLWYWGTGHTFDDIILYNGYIYAVDWEGILYRFINKPGAEPGKLCVVSSLFWNGTETRWCNRLVVEWGQLYVVVRTDDKVFHVYKSISRGQGYLETFEKVYQFHVSGHVLFIAKDYYFFRRVGLNFPGMHLENCIVFSQDAFPCYGDDAFWDFSQTDGIGFFRLRDKMFSREGELGEFPKLDWSPPPWVFDAWSGLAAESSSHSERDPREEECLASKSRDENAGEMEPDSIGQDTEQEVIESDKSQDEEDVQTDCDFNSPENEDEEVTQILLSMNARNGVTEGGASVKNTTTESIPRDFTPRTLKRRRIDPVTTKFEGCDVMSDSVPTLQKIWRNHGNIIKNSNLRNRDMIARALEFLSDMVQILENNSALSLSDSQAEFLSSTLSDLRCMQFEVNWLIPLVDKAIKLHESKHLQESLNNLSKSSSQVEERRAVLLEELAKLDEEKNKQKEEAAKVSMGIPFSGKFKFDELLGSGLT